MQNADKWIQPTKFTGEYPDNWNGYAFLDWHKSNNVYHPGIDYNFGVGAQDLGQDAVATAAGNIVHASSRTSGYGKILVAKHSLGYNLKRLISERYGIETDELYSLYAHLNDIKVGVGDIVDCGQVIAHVGKTGTISPHLHFEIYAPIGEIKNKPWRFYPIGWSKENIQKYWLPAYSFIELSKQAEVIDGSFLGKPKEYWLQVEKDRENLLKQVGEIDSGWAERLHGVENQLSTCQQESAKKDKEIKNLNASIKKEAEDFELERATLRNQITNKENRIAEILKDNAKEYKFGEALMILLHSIKVPKKKTSGGDTT